MATCSNDLFQSFWDVSSLLQVSLAHLVQAHLTRVGQITVPEQLGVLKRFERKRTTVKLHTAAHLRKMIYITVSFCRGSKMIEMSSKIHLEVP